MKSPVLLSTAIAFTSLLLSGCKGSSSEKEKVTTADSSAVSGSKDSLPPTTEPETNELFATVQLGEQKWMKANLDVSVFQNGDSIPQARNPEEWNAAGNAKQPAWCYYDYDATNGPLYGKLYNGYAVGDARGLAPAGWRVAGEQDWTKLCDFLGGREGVGTKLKAKEGWKLWHGASDTSGMGTGGFAALPGGKCKENGTTIGSKESGRWAAAGDPASTQQKVYSLKSDGVSLWEGDFSKREGFSVRCVKN